jgi:hypothetical protein
VCEPQNNASIPTSPCIVHADHNISSIIPLHPHLLEVLDNHHVGIHVAVDAVLHASVLASCESALRHAASDALLEADGV